MDSFKILIFGVLITLEATTLARTFHLHRRRAGFGASGGLGGNGGFNGGFGGDIGASSGFSIGPASFGANVGSGGWSGVGGFDGSVDSIGVAGLAGNGGFDGMGEFGESGGLKDIGSKYNHYGTYGQGIGGYGLGGYGADTGLADSEIGGRIFDGLSDDIGSGIDFNAGGGRPGSLSHRFVALPRRIGSDLFGNLGISAGLNMGPSVGNGTEAGLESSTKRALRDGAEASNDSYDSEHD